MIKISTEKEVVILELTHGHPVANYTSTFRYVRGNEFDAKLMADNLQKKLKSELEQVRKEAYEQGWSDAKGKRKKEDWFSGSF